MHLKKVWTVATSLKFCIDRVWFVELVGRIPLKMRDWIWRFFCFSPHILERALACTFSPEKQGERFSMAVSIFRFGNITKLTSPLRTVLANDEVLALGKGIAHPVFLEVGASDGSSSLPIYEAGVFFQTIPTDRFNCFYFTRFGPVTLFFDADERPFLAKLLCLSFDIRELSLALPDDSNVIETVNPTLRDHFDVDHIERFDIFRDISEKPVHIIKCSNLLNMEYYSPGELKTAVVNLARSLVDGGCIVISQNNEKYDGGEALFVLQKKKQRLVVIKNDNQHSVASLFAELG